MARVEKRVFPGMTTRCKRPVTFCGGKRGRRGRLQVDRRGPPQKIGHALERLRSQRHPGTSMHDQERTLRVVLGAQSQSMGRLNGNMQHNETKTKT